MKSILLSIKPKYVADIMNGEKTIEIRKTMPKCELPIDVYIYCTNGREVAIPSKSHSIYRYVKQFSWFQRKGCVAAKFTLSKIESIYLSPAEFGIANREFYVKQRELRTATMDGDGLLQKSCLTEDALHNYLNFDRNGTFGYAWHISDLVIFEHDKLMKLSDFGVKREPQSWQYVEELK